MYIMATGLKRSSGTSYLTRLFFLCRPRGVSSQLSANNNIFLFCLFKSSVICNALVRGFTAPMSSVTYKPWCSETDAENIFFGSINLFAEDRFYPCSGGPEHA